ncbi:MAG TPA: hypothetical protein VLG50_08020 [Candidatus Saccharimonadales bacterium]|nr:hypothetical protein [Candidatus Saccharimonadales bacterium]
MNNYRTNVLFTFDNKHPSNYNIKQLQKTCIYLGLDYHSLKKKQLYKLVLPYFVAYDNVPRRICIMYHDRKYYSNIDRSLFTVYKNIERTYSDSKIDVFKIISGNLYKHISYSKILNKWDDDKYDVTDKIHQIIINVHKFLDLQNLFVMLKYLKKQNVFIKDICTYIFHIYYTNCDEIVYTTVL